MSWEVLQPQIKEVLDTIDNMQETSLDPKFRFSGYPSAYIYPSDNEGDYETTQENIRTYAFRVAIFYESKVKGISDARSALASIVDDAIDAFDKEDLKGLATRKIGVSLPTGYTYINVWATPAEWGVTDDEELITAELVVRVRISVDIT